MLNESDNDDEAVVKAFDAGADAQIRQLHAVSRCAALIFGFICCAFVLYCICARTPQYFRSYSRLLLVSVIVDTTLL